jgi:hypothetical protein
VLSKALACLRLLATQMVQVLLMLRSRIAIFIIIKEGSYTRTAYPLDRVKAMHVRFTNCTFLVPDEFYQHLKRNLRKESDVPNRIEGALPAF